MHIKRFLESVAGYIADKYDDMSHLTLVFPNKRSAMFSKKYMEELLVRTSSRPRFMPRFVTMGSFVSRFAIRPEMNRNEQLFMLYDCYRSLLKELGREGQLRDFDRFIFWGSMILDDFDDIDRQLVDASKLFKNLRDLKEINADYLDDDQKQLLRQLFGESPRTETVTEFWTHVGAEKDENTPEGSFIALWQILDSLYPAFRAAIEAVGFDTAGGQYRKAAATISGYGMDDLNGHHYAFIGFNDLSKSETLICKHLKDIGAASFFWDFDSPMLDLTSGNDAGPRYKAIKRHFPMPQDFNTPVPDTLPKIEVIATPSAVAQAKAVSDILTQWNADNLISPANAINTAIVVPDEKLLTPLLMSIPDCIPAINITMGVSASATPFATMVRSIVLMQMRARKIHDRIHYYYADVIELLSHPHIQVIAATTAEKIKKYISRNNLFNLDAEDLCTSYPELSYLFNPVKALDNATEMCGYMLRLIDGLSDALKDNGNPGLGALPELELLAFFRSDIESLNELIDRYNITMSESTFFTLLERFIQSRRIDTKGTPLCGLQVMGVLETRALDFDNVIILSMNENTFPRKSYMRTMIPNNLRIGYGMTTIDRQDSLYTYYFYRLLSRARNVKLIYDSRSGSFGSGEPSRYIEQIKHLAPKGTVSFTTLEFGSGYNSPDKITVIKDDEVMRHLRRFYPGGNGYLSASALKEYKRCRLRFYLRYVRNLRGDNEINDYITASVHGTIVHKIAETLYSDYKDIPIDSSVIAEILANTARMDSLIAETVYEIYYRKARYSSSAMMPAEGEVTCDIIRLYLRSMLEIEKEKYAATSFRFIEGEKEVKSPPWSIDNRMAVNFKMSIDRVDRTAPDKLRFIDYKTGSDTVKPTTLDNIFTRGRHDDDAIFQLLTYCVAYADMVDASTGIEPVVYPLKTMIAQRDIPVINIDGQDIRDYRVIETEFRARLFELIKEIFSPDTVFDQVEDARACQYCPFLDLCGRTVPEW